MKLIVRKIQKSKENVSSIKTITVKERHSRLIPIVIYSNTRPRAHAVNMQDQVYDVTHVISIRGVRDIITSSGFIRFVNKEYKIQIIKAVHHHLW